MSFTFLREYFMNHVFRVTCVIGIRDTTVPKLSIPGERRVNTFYQTFGLFKEQVKRTL